MLLTAATRTTPSLETLVPKMKTAPIFSMYRRQVMTRYLEIMESEREFEDVKGVPPLDIILYRDLMDSRWSSDRLLPWMPGYVLFKVYSFYLNEYFYRNTPDPFSATAAAVSCLKMENKLSSTGFLTADVDALSSRIKQQALYLTELDTESLVAAACFMCIEEEAELMSELLACKAKNTVENDVFITEVLDDDSFNFSNKVRKAAFDILTTYKGPCSDSIAASLLGMKKEANLVRELLKLNWDHVDRFERLNICQCLRERLLKFLMDINDCKFTELMHGTAPATAISWEKSVHARINHDDMASCLESMKTEDVKDVPPLDIILYRDLMETTWSLDRLLPWTAGYVPFDFYLVYLNEYFYRNTPPIFNVRTATSSCQKMEEKLRCTEGLSADDVALSNKIKERAHCIITSGLESPVAAAGFMCIAEEAEFMFEFLASDTENSAVKDALGEDSYKLSKKIRKIAFDILNTYEGPCNDSIAASLLGMKKETSLLLELLKLNQDCMDRFARLKICKSVRQLLMQFLTDIHDSKFTELMTPVSGKGSGRTDEMLCLSTDDDGNGITVTAPRTAI